MLNPENKRGTLHSLNSLFSKLYNSSCQKCYFLFRSSKSWVWSISRPFKSFPTLWLASIKWVLNTIAWKKFLWTHLWLLNSCRKASLLPVYCSGYVLHVNKYITFSEEHFKLSCSLCRCWLKTVSTNNMITHFIFYKVHKNLHVS